MTDSVARVFTDVCSKQAREYWDYQNFHVTWADQSPYEVIRKIGRGKYSDVFDGFNNISSELCVIKVLKPVKKNKIKREVRVLQNLAGGPNIIQLLDCTRDPISRIPAFIFEHIDSTDFRHLYPTFVDTDIRYYIHQLLQALHFCHSKGIMHRDVKPHNVMIDHKKRKLRLIDFGLAEFYHPHQTYNVRVASRYFKGPELLVDFLRYDYSLDMWSLGCMFAGMIFRKEPFFRGSSNEHQLKKIVQCLGSDEFFAYLQKYRIQLPAKFADQLKGFPKVPFNSFINEKNSHLCKPEALDFLSHLLVFDHGARFTAEEAMAHQFFDPIRHLTTCEEAVKALGPVEEKEEE